MSHKQFSFWPLPRFQKLCKLSVSKQAERYNLKKLKYVEVKEQYDDSEAGDNNMNTNC